MKKQRTRKRQKKEVAQMRILEIFIYWALSEEQAKKLDWDTTCDNAQKFASLLRKILGVQKHQLDFGNSDDSPNDQDRLTSLGQLDPKNFPLSFRQFWWRLRRAMSQWNKENPVIKIKKLEFSYSDLFQGIL